MFSDISAHVKMICCGIKVRRESRVHDYTAFNCILVFLTNITSCGPYLNNKVPF